MKRFRSHVRPPAACVLVTAALLAPGSGPASEDAPLPPKSSRRGATCLTAGELDGQTVVVVGGDGGVDLGIGGRFRCLGKARNVTSLLLAGDRLLEGGGRASVEGSVRCWNWRNGEMLWEVKSGEDVVYSLARARDTVYAGFGDHVIRAFEAATGKAGSELEGHSGKVLALAASPEGRLLASAGTDRSIRLWETSGSRLLRSIRSHGDCVNALAWSADGALLASASSDRSVRIWKASIGRLLRIVRVPDSPVLELAFWRDRLFAGTRDAALREIDIDRTRPLEPMTAHEDWITGLAATSGELFSVDWSGRLVRWKREAGKVVPETILEPGRGQPGS